MRHPGAQRFVAATQYAPAGQVSAVARHSTQRPLVVSHTAPPALPAHDASVVQRNGTSGVSIVATSTTGRSIADTAASGPPTTESPSAQPATNANPTGIHKIPVRSFMSGPPSRSADIASRVSERPLGQRRFYRIHIARVCGTSQFESPPGLETMPLVFVALRDDIPRYTARKPWPSMVQSHCGLPSLSASPYEYA